MADMMECAEEMAAALRCCLATYPVFRLKPIGAPGSSARMQQDDAIAAEDSARAALARYEASK